MINCKGISVDEDRLRHDFENWEIEIWCSDAKEMVAALNLLDSCGVHPHPKSGAINYLSWALRPGLVSYYGLRYRRTNEADGVSLYGPRDGTSIPYCSYARRVLTFDKVIKEYAWPERDDGQIELDTRSEVDFL